MNGEIVSIRLISDINTNEFMSNLNDAVYTLQSMGLIVEVQTHPLVTPNGALCNYCLLLGRRIE